MRSIPPEEIPRVDFVFDIVQDFVIAVCDDRVAACFEAVDVVDDKRAEKCGAVGKCRFVDDNCRPFCLDALHYTLNRALAEVVAVALHR